MNDDSQINSLYTLTLFYLNMIESRLEFLSEMTKHNKIDGLKKEEQNFLSKKCYEYSVMIKNLKDNIFDKTYEY